MIGCDHALAQLLEAPAGNHPPKLGLADQKALEWRCIVDLEVRQHPELFERGLGKILGFVHNQQCASALLMGLVEESLQAKQQAAFVLGQVFKPEGCGHHVQQIMTG